MTKDGTMKKDQCLDGKYILDVCCGGRMFWFNKEHPNTIYCDIRTADAGHVGHSMAKNHSVQPDVVCDFTNLPFPDNQFKMVIFDPPHLTSVKPTSYMGRKYGILDKQTWPDLIYKGFVECYRVLDVYGVLIFKWSTHDIRLGNVLKHIPIEPLIGHTSGQLVAKNNTVWLSFMKLP